MPSGTRSRSPQTSTETGTADTIVGARSHAGATGKVYLYLGEANGLGSNAAWTATGEATGNFFGYNLDAAGDVNGDGYSDVVVGAFGYSTDSGKAYVHLGGPSGLAFAPVWAVAGENPSDQYGWSVSGAGDVNDDGYSDVIVGATSSASNGKAYLYLGSASGPLPSATWTASGATPSEGFGGSVSGAGDVNGDGFSDVIVGAKWRDSARGQAYVYYGGGGLGLPFLPRQRRSDLSAPIYPGALAYEREFALSMQLRSSTGHVARMLEWQVAATDSFLPWDRPIQRDDNWFVGPIDHAVQIDVGYGGHLWRARVLYDPAQSPYQRHSRWFTISDNGRFQTDVVGTSQPIPPPCTTPDEPIYISDMTIDGNGKPVIHYQDPNQPADVTGYNVYRAGTPQGPWGVLGSNVVDMDAGTPNHQFVDQTGDLGGPWFYQVAAYNGACDVEGPW